MSLKTFMWKFGLLPGHKCPVCGEPLQGHGYDDDGHSPGYYTCERVGCAFNEPEQIEPAERRKQENGKNKTV